MASQEYDDLRLIRASPSLLTDLEQSLPCLLWKGKSKSRVHQLVRLRDLDYIIQLIEPFQPEPQLLDTRLKLFLPSIVAAYLAYLQLPSTKSVVTGTVTTDVAASKILYTFCKVRGEKVITAFLNNEPRYLDLILHTLEDCRTSKEDARPPWEKSYILLLWLGHLLLAPFDLASISGPAKIDEALPELDLPPDVPSLTSRVMTVSMHYLLSATKEQDAASKLLVRLVIRPDMQRLHLPTSLVSWALKRLASFSSQPSATLHAFLGPLRFLMAMTVSPDSDETSKLVPLIYAAASSIIDDAMLASLISSAATGKILIKLFRNIAVLSLQQTTGVLAHFFETSSVLEDTIDYLLQALGDRDTPVRFAASKALSMIMLRLDPEYSHEVVQAILDSMKADMPRSLAENDFSTVDALRWHGLTLTLAHALFRRSASPTQLPEIVNALLLALTFEQRSTTGASIGSNVRDAACFGIWSLSRRYTTKELLSVDASEIRIEDGVPQEDNTIIQTVGIHLLLSACLDPAGNIRRGSSAALQELIGRHPDEVKCGIPLVQVVDYHAVGLRQRALVDVAHGASSLDILYRKALLMALLKWRGIGSPDITSREAAGKSIGRLCADQPRSFVQPVLDTLLSKLVEVRIDVEYSHGLLVALASLLDGKMSQGKLPYANDDFLGDISYLARSWHIFERHQPLYVTYTPRSLRADLFPAVSRAIGSVTNVAGRIGEGSIPSSSVRKNIAEIVSGLVSRSEDPILSVLPSMAVALTTLDGPKALKQPILDVKGYMSRLRADASGATLTGAGRAITLAATFPWLENVYEYDPIEVPAVLGVIVKTAPTTEWRVVGLQALLLIIESGQPGTATAELFWDPLHTGLNDYTITERGDVGSHVRGAAIACVDGLWKHNSLAESTSANLTLLKDLTRLSLEKLDRTRLQAARCLKARIESGNSELLTDVSSITYFRSNLGILTDVACPAWALEATIEGCASCAGVGSEALLQSARAALVETICASEAQAQLNLMNTLVALLKTATSTGQDSQPLLELLAFLLDAVPSLHTIQDFSWRNLLALVQKSHYKSTGIPKILAAVEVYRGLIDKTSIRPEVLKKLASMLKSNPYPRIRIAVAECLYLATKDDKLKYVNWNQPGHRYEILT